MEQLKFGDKTISYEMRPHMRAKRIKITITQDKVRVSFPQGIDTKKVKEFVESKKEWIVSTLESYKAQQAGIKAKNYLAGEEYFFLGKSYVLRTQIYEGVNAAVELKPDEIWIYLSKEVPEKDRPLWVKGVLTAWYKDKAGVVFREKLDYYSRMMGLKYNQLRVKNQSTRWGSCSGKGNINLNWRVIMAPDQVINYLIVHELAHLRYMNHSKDYWNLVAQFMPEYEKWRKWLKENGKFLII